jgi:hypothetical protein
MPQAQYRKPSTPGDYTTHHTDYLPSRATEILAPIEPAPMHRASSFLDQISAMQAIKI